MTGDDRLNPDIMPKGKHIKDILPKMLDGVKKAYATDPRQVFAKWDKIVGEDIAKMARPVIFKDGVLHIKVSNSTLLSILERQEKQRLLKQLMQECPQSQIQNILFKIG